MQGSLAEQAVEEITSVISIGLMVIYFPTFHPFIDMIF
jgi:hypothetical protein